ncbi:MAG: endonuclease III, partial [Mogibacterium sp.]|nr:endonuclease III [Mogibacterium sp.]
VNKATPALFAKYPTPSALADADQADVIGLIRAIGLYKTKSSNIIKLAQKLENEYGGEVPSDFDSLVSLPGTPSLASAARTPASSADSSVICCSS